MLYKINLFNLAPFSLLRDKRFSGIVPISKLRGATLFASSLFTRSIFAGNSIIVWMRIYPRTCPNVGSSFMYIAHSLSNTDLIILAIFFITFAIFLLAVKYQSKNFSALEYLAMGRALTLPGFVITLVSSWYGSVVGATQIAYKYGIYNFFALGVFWYLSAFIFAVFIAGKLSASKVLSLPEYVKKAYGPRAEKLVLILMFIKTLPVAYIMAFSMIISALFGLNEANALIIAMLFALLLYTRSSLKAVMIVDFMQFITIFTGMAIVLYFCINKLGGLDYLVANLPDEHLTIGGGNDYSKMMLWFMVALSSTVLSPIFHQRCFAAKTPKTAKIGIVISIVFWIISDVLTTTGGLYARAYLGEGHDAHAYLELMPEILPPGMLGYMIAAMIITAISALDSYVFASKSLIVNYYNTSNKTMTGRSHLFLGFVISCGSTLLAMGLYSDLEKGWLLFESAFIASLLIPVVVSLYNKHGLSAPQFFWVVSITFIATAVIEYQHLSSGGSIVLIAIALNALTIGGIMLKRLKLSKKM
ncbi:MAG: putative sodium:solute symporter [Candidatus Midichloriaceae bacterium]|nr:putative sodium:solute symporter [Candidatus Midichloriaceae bacterium]